MSMGFTAFVSVIVDIPTRSLAEPFTYTVPSDLAERAEVGCMVLVRFGNRPALGYVIARASSLADLPGAASIDRAKLKPIRDVLTEPLFSEESAVLALWMAQEYVASPAECLRLFLPPGASPRLRRGEDGSYTLDRPAAHPVTERVVSLTDEGRSFRPARNAVRQRQLIEALSCGPVSTRELKALYMDMSATIRALEKRGVVWVDERRAWRAPSDATTLSSARSSAPRTLTSGQQEALAAINRALEAETGDVVLIDGVTGSGKTEVYLLAIERALARGESACVLVPEISLTAQTVGRFRSRFGDAVAVFHSRLSAGERLDQWDMVRSGAAKVVVGARSALFCPLERLGLIVIDEEHEQSYKQGSSPRYHAREVAAHIARTRGIPLVLGSATPSAESLARAKAGEYLGQRWVRVEMPERPAGSVLPSIFVADLRREFARGSRSMFSKQLEEALLGVAERHEKAVLLHNRRGFASFLMCRECGCVPTCKHCSTALTYHERTHTLECHTCGAVYHVRPYPEPGSSCPKCGSRYLAKMGVGTQQVEDALRALLPEHVQVIRMDADTTKGKDGHKRLLEQFDAADTAVLLGTQMIAKGLDFPEVTLVGVVMADYALKMPDFRASERAYDLLEQVAGRAGRGTSPGQVIIQTYLPNDPVIQAVATHDRSRFTDRDLAQRREVGYPPFVRLSNVIVSSKDEDAARQHAERIAGEVRKAIAHDVVDPAHAGFAQTSAVHPVNEPVRAAHESPLHAGAGAGEDGSDSAASSLPSLVGAGSGEVASDSGARPVVLGPVPCVIKRAKDRFRFHVLVKSPVGYHISEILRSALDHAGTSAHVSVSVDVDAYDLM